VAIVGGVYEAGVARAWRGDGDPETEVTRVLMEQANLIQNRLGRLQECRFDQQTAGVIVELHGHIARAISHRSGDVCLTSFVSKYLHFHCPIVPIYDSNTQDAIGELVDWKLVDPIRAAMAKLPEWARAYRNFVAAFVVLHERANAETSLKPTVKELEHLLWQPERAFVRSLYHQNRLRHPRRSISRPEWHEVTPNGRRVIITTFSGSSGVDHVEQHPESSYVEHPELRPGGLLSDEGK